MRFCVVLPRLSQRMREVMVLLVRVLAARGFPSSADVRGARFHVSGVPKWLAQSCCDRDWGDAVVTNALTDAHADDPEFGCRFLADELHQTGLRVGGSRV
jgi:putative transposase